MGATETEPVQDEVHPVDNEAVASFLRDLLKNSFSFGSGIIVDRVQGDPVRVYKDFEQGYNEGICEECRRMGIPLEVEVACQLNKKGTTNPAYIAGLNYGQHQTRNLADLVPLYTPEDREILRQGINRYLRGIPPQGKVEKATEPE